jgi:hypothetical protein
MDMSAWIGLIGVAAGALAALIGQYLVRNSEARERRDTILLEQLATLVALSEDFRNRVWEERNKVAANVVAAWTSGRFGLQRLDSEFFVMTRICCPRLLRFMMPGVSSAGHGG